MERRQFVFTLLLAVLGSGCARSSLSDNEDGDSESDERPDPSEDIFVTVSNRRSQRVVAGVVVLESRGRGSVITERSVLLDPGESTAIYTGITSPGDYPYEIYLDGELAFEATYNVGEFDVETGSNIDIGIEPDELDIGAED
ncbi:hypothetical protein GRX03_06415 [Halovenus sp. WSH3]|uniref:Uncharacterized protein n=1 Tax=Halovenus carboxidivorans TaxID=2692199 RepID=A0A6B0T4Y0_9EURY|nr:hypothetical protein [Halovenus carboxidivorans]MXR51236.1 hypothetical protein [Halovenus carboxidivorans]